MPAPTRTQRQARERRKVSAQRRVEEHTSGFERSSLEVPEGTKFFNPKKEGSYRIEIIPYETGEGNPHSEKGDLYYERTYFNHRDIGPKQEAYVCPAMTYERRCPICEYRAQLMRDPKADKEEVKALMPKERQLFNIVDLTEPDKGVQLWEISFHLFGKHLDKKIKNADDEDMERYQYFADPEDGSSLKLGASEKTMGGGKPFLEFSDIEFRERKEAIGDDILSQAICLDDIIKELPYDKLKAIFYQIPEDTTEEVEEVTPPKRDRTPAAAASPARGKPPGRAPAKPEPEEEPEPEPETPAEEPEDPTAEELGLEVNMEIEHAKLGTCTIKHISDDGTSIRLEDSDGKLHKGIAPSECEAAAEPEPEPPPARGKPAANGRAAAPAPKRPVPAANGRAAAPAPKRPVPAPKAAAADDWDDDSGEPEEEPFAAEEPAPAKKPAPRPPQRPPARPAKR